MKQGLVTFGVILIVVGVGLLFLNNYVFTKTETRPGPFGIGEQQQTEGVTFGIPNGLVWFAIIAGAALTTIGLVYDPIKRQARYH